MSYLAYSQLDDEMDPFTVLLRGLAMHTGAVWRGEAEELLQGEELFTSILTIRAIRSELGEGRACLRESLNLWERVVQLDKHVRILREASNERARKLITEKWEELFSRAEEMHRGLTPNHRRATKLYSLAIGRKSLGEAEVNLRISLLLEPYRQFFSSPSPQTAEAFLVKARQVFLWNGTIPPELQTILDEFEAGSLLMLEEAS